MENVVIMTLEHYEEMQSNYEIAKADYKSEFKKNLRMQAIKTELLESYLEEYRVKNYELDEITDITDYKFALKNPAKLLTLGFELKELTEFITSKYKEAHAEVAEDE